MGCHKLLIVSAVVAWILLLGSGELMLARYESTPGPIGITPLRWPSASQLVRTPNLSTLILFVHPRCPCTRATMNQLALIMAHAQHRVLTYVVFIRLKEFPQSWVETDLWAEARGIPGVKSVIDDEGREARLFGAETSGETMLYDQYGHLVFSGGITSARGHEGDNLGQKAIVTFLNTGTILTSHTPVFGCTIINRKPDHKPMLGAMYDY